MLERGSQWRRWDLHVHTPETALNDQFGSWDEYVAEINAQDAVRVIGATDYFLFGNYSKLKAYRGDGKLPVIDLLIPNIEFRIAPPSDKASALNIHLFVSPDDPNHEQELHDALARLKWKFGEKNYSCLRPALIALGKAFDAKITDERTALEAGVTQFKIDFSAFRSWYDDEPWLKAHSIVVVDAGKDGLSGFYKEGGWGAWRDEITRFSQALFSGRPGEREFWLCRRSKEDAETVIKLGGSKPCLHGLDAHKIAELFRPAEHRFCWIKADTTFEGLRQVLYEPADRVHIGPSKPLYHDEARVIQAVRLSHSDGWFDDIEIPLNAGLVSIIGQKGSGKSALAEIIAYAAGSWVTDEAGSFLRRAGSHLKEMKAQLVWADDEVTTVTLGDEQSDDRAVRYLSQKFVERLCADDHLGDELVEEIENVIFSYIDESDKLNASSFRELRALRTGGTRAEGQRLRDDVTRLIAEACDLREKQRAVPEKKARIKTLDEDRKGLQKQLPKAASKEEEKTQKVLQEKRSALAALQKEAGEDKQRLQKIRDIRTALTSFATRMARFYTELEPDLKDVSVPGAERAVFKPAFPGDTEKPLTAREKAIKASIAKREGDPETAAAGTIRALQKEIDELAKKESADKAKTKRIAEIQKRIGAIDTETDRLTKEIAQIEGPNKQRLAAATAERTDAYVAYFDNLRTEQVTLEELYAPVTARLKSEDSFAQEQELEFSIRWEVDLDGWLARGGALFDQRRAIPNETMDGLKRRQRTFSCRPGPPAIQRRSNPRWISFLSRSATCRHHSTGAPA